MTGYGHNSGAIDARHRLAEEIRTKSKEYAEASGMADYWSEWKKIVFSEIVNQQGDMAISKAEHIARADPKYRDAVKKAIDYGTRANILKGEVRSLEIEWETWRTIEATRRSEMRAQP